MQAKRFNVRVYGICVQDGKLLLTDEIRLHHKMTKLPGGGLEFDEGIAEGLIREFQEEMGVDVAVGEVFYINPFLQYSAFRKSDQLLSMYFWVDLLEEPQVRFTQKRYDFEAHRNNEQVFRWVAIDELSESDFTFPIDRAMLQKLKSLVNLKK